MAGRTGTSWLMDMIIKAALKDYTLCRKSAVATRYAFGYWWSRYWLYSDKEFRNLIDNFHTYQIPLDVLVVDMDWHYTEQGKKAVGLVGPGTGTCFRIRKDSSDTSNKMT